jgi:hypothetical protein
MKKDSWVWRDRFDKETSSGGSDNVFQCLTEPRSIGGHWLLRFVEKVIFWWVKPIGLQINNGRLSLLFGSRNETVYAGSTRRDGGGGGFWEIRSGKDHGGNNEKELKKKGA